jgi:hypothetical protein
MQRIRLHSPAVIRTDRWRSACGGIVLGLVIAVAMVGCIVQRFTGPRLTGTCDGACAHYIQCKPGHSAADRDRCLVECPDVFSDRDSLMGFERLSCDDAVEFVDGSAAKTAASRSPRRD